jgi:hypothetical protein
MKIYYVADQKEKTRIPVECRKLSTAQAFCEALNQKHGGGFQCGDWIEHTQFLENLPNEWPWAKPTLGRHLV